MSAAPDSGRSSYLDLLIAVLSEHEKNMDKILERMEKMSEDLAKAERVKGDVSQKGSVTVKEVETIPEGADTVIYMKIKLSRPLDEVLKILQSLKE